jgi:hypothetical protein
LWRGSINANAITATKMRMPEAPEKGNSKKNTAGKAITRVFKMN